MDYRDVLATVVGASVAGIIAFTLRLVFPINAAVLALIYAASYSLLWSIVGDHARLLFHKRLPASTRLDGHWRLITGGIALTAALCAGLIVAFALSRPTFVANDSTTGTVTSRLVTRTLALQQQVVVTKKTIILPVKTTVVTTPVTETTGSPAQSAGTNTIYAHTVVVERPPVTVTVSSTRSRTATVVQTQTQTTPAVTSTAPPVTSVVTTVETVPPPDTTVGTTPTETSPAP